MTRSPQLAALLRAFHIARLCDRQRLPSADGIERWREAEGLANRGRRDWLRSLAHTSAVGAAAAVALPVQRLFAGPAGRSVDVGIVGAGLAGLACADALAGTGITPAIYDANTRTGGRCWSLRGVFPGQVAERGGEFIDTAHKTMLRYARRFGLAVEDVTRDPGEVVYYFGGQHVPESAVVDEFREFVTAIRRDRRALSGEITALSHTGVDVAIDHTSLAEYLDGANGVGLSAGPIAKAAIAEAYVAEYGLEPDEQSCLNFLLFIHADRRSKFTPFGVFSDERYHVAEGNDRIVEGLTQGLRRPVELGSTLVRVRRAASGGVELTFDTAGGTRTRTHDVVVLTIPFSVLRSVELDPNLDLTPQKRAAIDLLGYGANAKMMVGFDSRPWAAQGSNGSSYSDLESHQTTWESNASRATASRSVITDYSGGVRGASLNPAAVQVEADAFLSDLDLVYPGARAAASRRADGTFVAHLEHWPSNPLTRGSYTCYLPGQFTTIAGLEGQPAGSLLFAGEHADSFYSWQGFMEGAALSGLQAAAAILAAARR